MAFFNLFKEKIIEPVIHENEQGLTLLDGVHILINCNKVKLDGTAIVLESHNSNYDLVKGKTKIQILNGGKIREVAGKAKLGIIKDTFISSVKGRVEITTINSCAIDYVKDRVYIRTFNNGNIKFLDGKSKIDTMNNGKILFVRDKSKIGTLNNGYIEGVLNNAQISTIQNGKINYLLNKAYIGTINSCQINEVCDDVEIGTLADGQINLIVGNSIVCQQMGGKIVSKQEGTLVVYSYKKDNKPKSKRFETKAKDKDETLIQEEKFKKESIIAEQTSLLDLEDNK